ncbi:MAG: NAD-dependent epimerase/dehydratase family protein [Mangrovibacterium sp.]
MKILVIGNMGYVGPGTVSQLRSTYPDAELIGYDMGYFANHLTDAEFLPEVKLNQQIIGDVRQFPAGILEGVDAIAYLAAISNDPMSAIYEEITMDVNYRSCVQIAKMAKAAGVKSFVFASSCSIYGAASEYPKTETDTVNPLTAYARSKIAAEKELAPLADKNFTITCLRFATACGMSKRLRLDLVLNDFVAGAIISKEINILSDGTPWRPLINVLDMALAIDWGIQREASNGGEFLIVNTGTSAWNYQVKDLAKAVGQVVPGCRVTVKTDAPADKRSYQVNFDLYKKLAPDHQPKHDLMATIQELYSSITAMQLNDANFRDSKFMRLKILASLRENGYLNENLSWTW